LDNQHRTQSIELMRRRIECGEKLKIGAAMTSELKRKQWLETVLTDLKIATVNAEGTGKTLEDLRAIGMKYFPALVRRWERHSDIIDISEPDAWLERICMISQMIILEDQWGDKQLVAISLVDSDSMYSLKRSSIRRPEMYKFRQILGISQHWVIKINREDQPKGKELWELMEMFHYAVEKMEQCQSFRM
jgi:hypothetical protein